MPGFVPGRRATFVSAKVAKTIAAPSGLVGGKGRQPFEERTNSREVGAYVVAATALLDPSVPSG
jgi:hypothetical protein